MGTAELHFGEGKGKGGRGTNGQNVSQISFEEGGEPAPARGPHKAALQSEAAGRSHETIFASKVPPPMAKLRGEDAARFADRVRAPLDITGSGAPVRQISAKKTNHVEQSTQGLIGDASCAPLGTRHEQPLPRGRAQGVCNAGGGSSAVAGCMELSAAPEPRTSQRARPAPNMACTELGPTIGADPGPVKPHKRQFETPVKPNVLQIASNIPPIKDPHTVASERKATDTKGSLVLG